MILRRQSGIRTEEATRLGGFRQGNNLLERTQGYHEGLVYSKLGLLRRQVVEEWALKIQSRIEK